MDANLRAIVGELGENWEAVANEIVVTMSPGEGQRSATRCKGRWTKLEDIDEEKGEKAAELRARELVVEEEEALAERVESTKVRTVYVVR